MENEYKNDFIAASNIVNKEAADNLINHICWDNWLDDEEEEEVYFKVESVIWNRLMAINEDEETYKDEKDDVFEQIELYFNAVGEKVANLSNINSLTLEHYFEELTIEYASFHSFQEVYNNADNLRTLINSEVNVSTLNLEQ